MVRTVSLMGKECSPRWVRDVSMGEDDSQVRTGAAPEVMAAIRNVVLNLLRWAGAGTIAAARRYYSWKVAEALSLIGLPHMVN